MEKDWSNRRGYFHEAITQRSAENHGNRGVISYNLIETRLSSSIIAHIGRQLTRNSITSSIDTLHNLLMCVNAYGDDVVLMPLFANRIITSEINNIVIFEVNKSNYSSYSQSAT